MRGVVLCIRRPDYSHRPWLNTFDGAQYLQHNVGGVRFDSAPRAPPGHIWRTTDGSVAKAHCTGLDWTGRNEVGTPSNSHQVHSANLR